MLVCQWLSGLTVWAEQGDRRPCTQDSVGGLSVSFAMCLWHPCLALSVYLLQPLLLSYTNSCSGGGNGSLDADKVIFSPL